MNARPHICKFLKPITQYMTDASRLVGIDNPEHKNSNPIFP